MPLITNHQCLITSLQVSKAVYMHDLHHHPKWKVIFLSHSSHWIPFSFFVPNLVIPVFFSLNLLSTIPRGPNGSRIFHYGHPVTHSCVTGCTGVERSAKRAVNSPRSQAALDQSWKSCSSLRCWNLTMLWVDVFIGEAFRKSPGKRRTGKHEHNTTSLAPEHGLLQFRKIIIETHLWNSVLRWRVVFLFSNFKEST